MDTETTRTQIVRHAQRLIQERGYNGFSYRDLAELVGIKTSSIHYYFPQKDDLLMAVISDYQARWHEGIRSIPSTLRADDKLRAYVDVHRRAFCGNQRICVGAVLAAELASLPAAARQALQAFYICNENWLVQLLEQGAHDGSLRVPSDLRASARAIYAALQGGLVSARLFDHEERMTDLLPCVVA
jgi:TetR/AcrR family transcriptional repressor of nem operon